MSVTKGSIKQILNSEIDGNECTLQIIDLIDKGSGKFKVELTDGEGKCTGMIKATDDNKPVNLSLIKFKVQMMLVQNIPLIVIKTFEQVGLLEEALYDINNNNNSDSSSSNEASSTATKASNPVTPSNKNNNINKSNNNTPQQSTLNESPYDKENSSPTSVTDSNSNFNKTHDESGKPLQKAPTNTTPLGALNPYKSSWIVKARVTAKSEIKTWNNARGSGKLFSVDLLDNEGGEMRGTFFNDTVTKYYDMIHEQKVYTFQNGTLKQAGHYDSLNANTRYSISFSQYSVVTQVAEEDDIKKMSFSFTKIGDVSGIEANSSIDILAVVKACTDVSEIQSKNRPGTILKKRELTVCDSSQAEIRLTLWGDKATNDEHSWSSQPIIAVKGCRVGEYNNGKTLSTQSNSSLIVNPLDIKEAYDLHAWRKDQVNNGGFKTVSVSSTGGGAGGDRGPEELAKREPLSKLKKLAESLDLPEKGVYNSFTATVTRINDTKPYYEACPDCKRKVQQTVHGDWACERCEKSHENCDRRYILSMQLSDATGAGWFSTFNDEGTDLIGMNANELYECGVEGGEEAVKSKFASASFKQYVVRVRSKFEMVKDERRLKNTIVQLHPMDYANECTALLDIIDKY